MASVTMMIRLNNEEKSFIAGYAAAFGTTVSEFVRTAALEKTGDELDLRAWCEAKAEFDADPEMIPASDVARKYL